MSSELFANGTYFIEAKQQATLLELTDGDEGTILTTWSFSGAQNQQWQLQWDPSASRCRVTNVLYPSMYITQPTDQSNPSGYQYIESGSDPFDWFVKPMNGGYIFSADPAFVNAWNVAAGSFSDNNTVISWPLDAEFDNSIWMLASTTSESQNHTASQTAIGSNETTSIPSDTSTTPFNITPTLSDTIPVPSDTTSSPPSFSPSSSIGDIQPEAFSARPITLTVPSETTSASVLSSFNVNSTSSTSAMATSAGVPVVGDTASSQPSVNLAVVAGAIAAGVVSISLALMFLSWKKGWCCCRKRGMRAGPRAISPFPTGYASTATQPSMSQYFSATPTGYVSVDVDSIVAYPGLAELPPYERVSQMDLLDSHRRLETDNIYKYR
ncbi:hypothetical protein CERSUDRAFT_96577 [Gelatoporia subvermispora B]|uniref:Uncharacterized protein n=1 Tax=Ceriporiopsis subvermispora (strain B) TaxID=914234 RepID=M2QTR7_CERS8|nr:hypothetical protein CERSUDRAFT_96577 [Gelatoporia subvermispora B]